MRRILLVAAGLVVLLVVAVVAAGRPLLATLIEWQVESRGIDRFELRVEAWSPGHVRFSDIAADDPALGVHVRLDAVTARFTLGELLAGRVREVTVEGGELRYTPPRPQADAEPTDSAATPLAFVPALPLTAPEWLPGRLTLRGVSVQEPGSGRRWTADADIRVDDGRPVGDVTLSSADTPQPASLSMAGNGTVTVVLPVSGSDAEPALTAVAVPATPAGIFRIEFDARLGDLGPWLSMVPGLVPPPDLGGSLSATGEVDVADPSRVMLSLDLSAGDLSAAGLTLEAGSAAIRGGYDFNSRQWSAAADNSLSVDGLATAIGSAGRVQASGPYRIDFRDDGTVGSLQPDVTLSVEKASLAGYRLAHIRTTVRGDLRLAGDSVSWDAGAGAIEVDGIDGALFSLASARLGGGYAVRYAESGLVLAPIAGTTLEIAGLSSAGNRVPALALAVADVEMPPGEGIRVAPSSWTAATVHVEREDSEGATALVDASDLSFEITRLGLAPLDMVATVRAAGLTAVTGDPGLPMSQLELSLTVDDERIEAEATAHLADGISPVSARYVRGAADDPGRVTWSAGPVDLAATGRPLSAYLEVWPLAADLVSGTVAVAGVVRPGDDPVAVDAVVEISSGGGAWDPFYFSDLELRLPLTLSVGDETTMRAAPVPVRVGEIDVGVVLADVRGTLGFEPSSRGPLPRLLLGPASARLLDGSLVTEPVTIDLNDPGGALPLRLEAIDLAELIRLQNVQGLEATGRIDGRLPLRIDDAGPSMDSGRLSARDPGGHIEYRPPGDRDALAASTPVTGVVLDALENFDYRILNADVSLTTDGDSTIRLEIQGISSKVSKTRPVHLNINLEQNIYDLVRSLRYVQGLNERLDQRVQEYFEQRGP